MQQEAAGEVHGFIFDILQGVFYSLLSKDADLAHEIHDKPAEVGKQYKFFCFSDLQGSHTVRNGSIRFPASFTWEIRSADERILGTVLQSAEEIQLGNTNCRLTYAQRTEYMHLTDSVELTMMTPLAVYTTEANGHRRFFSPDEDEFYRNTEKNLINKYKELYGKCPEADILIEPIRVVPADKCVTKYKGWYVTGYYGKYRLTAPKDVIELAYHTGLGVKNSAGFGMFQI